MKQDAETLLKSLKALGCRMTTTRKLIVSHLCNTESPVSALELLTFLSKKNMSVNKTTVYRELAALLEKKVIREIDLLDGLKRYELLDPENHHHHLVCIKCKKVKCIEMDHDLDLIERRITRSHHFTVQSHVLEFFGLCQRCVS